MADYTCSSLLNVHAALFIGDRNKDHCEPTFPQVRIYGHVSCCSSEALVLPVRNVFFGFRIDVFFGQAKVYDVNDVLFFVALPSDEKVLWLHVPVDEVLGVHVFHAGDLARGKKEKRKRGIGLDQ